MPPNTRHLHAWIVSISVSSTKMPISRYLHFIRHLLPCKEDRIHGRVEGIPMQGSGRRGDACRVVAKPAASANHHATSTKRLSTKTLHRAQTRIAHADAASVTCLLVPYLSIKAGFAWGLDAGLPGCHAMVLCRIGSWVLGSDCWYVKMAWYDLNM